VTPTTGPTTTFTAGPKAGTGTVTATAAGLTGNVAVTVTPGPIHVASIRYGIGKNALLVTATVVDAGGRPIPRAVVSLLVRRRGYYYFSSQGTTAANGRKTFRLRPRPGCYRTTVIRVSGSGYRWVGKTPANRFCK
jgi:protocatechuate 3,4-dioxygenase beta subunit